MVIFENFYQKIIRYIVPRGSRSTRPVISTGFSIDFFYFLCYYSYVLKQKSKKESNETKNYKKDT